MNDSSKLLKTLPPEDEDARLDVLTENTAQDIFFEISKLENNREQNETRWLWELLQNALDASPENKGTRVRIRWDGTQLTFEHQGRPFKRKEITHLIYHGSSKYGDPEQRGKFGRGFLVTHLLSKAVTIRGIQEDSNGCMRFEFVLRREGDANQLQMQMDEAYIQKIRSAQPVTRQAADLLAYSTQYVYMTDSTGATAVKAGIAAAGRCLPFVLAFASELQQVTLETANGTRTWEKEVVGQPEDSEGFRRTQVTVEAKSLSDDIESEVNRVFVIERTVRSMTGGETASVAVAISDGKPPMLLSDDLVPRFFADSFPLVGTEQISLPVVFHSRAFGVDADRTGLHLEGDETPEQLLNWQLLKELRQGTIDLLKYASEQGWTERHVLGQISSWPQRKWFDPERVRDRLLVPVVHAILEEHEVRLVETRDGNWVDMTGAVIPVDDPGGTLFGLLAQWKTAGQALVNNKLALTWAACLTSWAVLLSKKPEDLPGARSVEDLAEEVASLANLVKVAEGVDLPEGETATEWLNRLVGFLIERGHETLLTSLSILPNQNGILCGRSVLDIDGGIDDKLKDIANEAGIDERARLLEVGINAITLAQRQESEVVALLWGRIGKAIPEANSRFLEWLAITPEYHDRLSNFPVFTEGEAQVLDKRKPLLKPISLWPQAARPFADLFPQDYALAAVYGEALNLESWILLEGNGLVRDHLIFEAVETELDNVVTVGAWTEEDEKATHHIEVRAQYLSFLDEKGKGIIDNVKNSKAKAVRLLDFVLSYLSKVDQSWETPVALSCGCGKTHQVLPCAWLRDLKNQSWVPIQRGQHQAPTAENLAKMVTDDLLSKWTQDLPAISLLNAFGVGVSEILRARMMDPRQRISVDRLAARIYVQNEATRELLSKVLEDPDAQEMARKHFLQQAVVARNQELGRIIEKLVALALKDAGLSVERKPVGSDYEVENDVVEGGLQQGLIAGKYLLEVKGTTSGDVRMTLVQGDRAVNLPPGYAGYVLCVCKVPSGELSDSVVEEHARFMFDIGLIIRDAVLEGNELKDKEDSARRVLHSGISLEVGPSSKRIVISPYAWEAGEKFLVAMERFRS